MRILLARKKESILLQILEVAAVIKCQRGANQKINFYVGSKCNNRN